MKPILICLTACFLFACTQPKPADEKASNNKARMMHFYADLVNAHNAAMVDSFFHTDVVDHLSMNQEMHGSAEVKKGFEDFFTAFPDAHLDHRAFYSSGDTIAVQLRMTGTNTGPLNGQPATRKPIDITGIAVFAWKDGKISERWRYFDDILLLHQLGILPAQKDSTEEGRNK